MKIIISITYKTIKESKLEIRIFVLKLILTIYKYDLYFS
jgi:hypothetical protein